MNKTRTFLAVVIAAVSLAVLPAIASAQTAAEVFDAIDDVVHHWQDGELTAEEALEEIEELLHSIPASQRSPILAAIDEVVHHAEDGDIEPKAAMELIEAIIHGAGGVSHAGPANPTPAVTGTAGLLATSPATGLATLVALTAMAIVLGAGRVLTRVPARR